jgi:hypothetical protein
VTEASSTEPPIDTSLHHYMEERALAIALDKSATAGQRCTVERLIETRAVLMKQRDAFLDEATTRRHARGEIYSSARVAAINAMGPTKADLDRDVRALYVHQPNVEGVLIAHARTHFAHALIASRLQLAMMPPDIAEAARDMQAREEAFAAAWVGAIEDPSFVAELKTLQREALRMLRTSTRPMYLVADPPSPAFDDADAVTMGKGWNRLDALCAEIGLEPLSGFIALPGEDPAADRPAADLLATLTALIERIRQRGEKFPAKTSTLGTLTKARSIVMETSEANGRVRFEMDT